MDAMNSAETNPKERDSESRVRENRLHGLTRGIAASAGFRLAALSTLLKIVYFDQAVGISHWANSGAKPSKPLNQR